MSPRMNKQRLIETFITLCEIDSPSRHEKLLANYLRSTFQTLGATSITEDNSGETTGSDCGNLIIRFEGNTPNKKPIFFSCHMDTVEPGRGIRVELKDDIFTSRGDTILGSDDKSGITAIIELIHMLKESNADYGPIELIFTTCEEIGLLGVKNLDPGLIQASYGYALDSTGIDTIITGAPAANRIKIKVHGVAAHAGLNPDQGVSAFCLAAKAIADLRLGRLDDQSTANFGLIHGGVATNIIPDLITIEGEVRSHSSEKLERYTREIESTFLRVAQEWKGRIPVSARQPWVDIEVEKEYPAMRLNDTDPILRRAIKAGEILQRDLSFQRAGGGSDANILASYGLETAIIATGMDKVHTTDECLDLNDLCSLTELLFAIVTA